MANIETVQRLEEASLQIKFDLLDLCNQEPIHIGGDLSLCDMMVAIWQYAMKYDVNDPEWAERDRFVLSKGHAAAVTTFNQAAIGCYKKEEVLNEYATDFGRFGMHSCNLINPYVEVSTGSLGHGFPVATGIATGLKRQGSNSRVFVVMGDGELNEGSIWEAIMTARQYKLGNLVGFVDNNRLSFDGKLDDIMSLAPLADKWRAFGWNVIEINGHEMTEIVDAIDSLPQPDSDVPTVIIGNTLKGNGVSIMENNPGWHAGSVANELLIQAKNELQATFDKRWGVNNG